MEGGGPPAPSHPIPVSVDAYCNNISFSSTAPAHADAAAAAAGISSSSSSSSPAVARLRKLLFRRMLIGVNDGRYFQGLFHCVDKQGNIILQDAVEYRGSAGRHGPHGSQLPTPTELQRCLGLILIPAACRSSCEVDCSVGEKMSLLCLE